MLEAVREWFKRNFRRGERAPQGPIAFDADNLHMMDGEAVAWSMPWRGIARVNAFRLPGYIGDAVTLVFEGPDVDGRALSEDIQGWREMIDALPQHLPGALKPEGWYVQLIAKGPEGTISIFERG